jgi:hypothetical protein
MGWIENGYKLFWANAASAPRAQKNSRSALDETDFVSAAIADMLKASAIDRLPSIGVKPSVVSPLEVVPKARIGKLRLIMNLRYVNRHLIKKVFKFEGLSDLTDLADKSDFSVAYDLASGHYHVGLYHSSKTYVGFEWEGTFYVCNCLPFGLSTAPWVFSKVVREIVMFWRRKGIRLPPYLDDLFFIKQGWSLCAAMTREVECDMFNAGLQISSLSVG